MGKQEIIFRCFQGQRSGSAIGYHDDIVERYDRLWRADGHGGVHDKTMEFSGAEVVAMSGGIK
jgi:hypothetical protein